MNIATFHAFGGWSPAYEFGSRVMRGYADRLHGRIAVSAAARHFIDRFFPGDYKVIPNGVDVARSAGRAHRPLAGRHAQPPVRRPPRAAQGPARPAQGAPDPAQDRLQLPAAHRRHGAPGARGAPLRPDPPDVRRRVPGPGHRRGEGPAVQDGRRLRLAGDRPRVVRDRPARGDGGRRADRVPATSTATRASSGAASRACSSRRASPRRSPAAVAQLLRRSGPARADERERARRGPRSSAGSGSPPRSRRTTASSSAAWPPTGALPSDFHAPIPPAPPRQNVAALGGRRGRPAGPRGTVGSGHRGLSLGLEPRARPRALRRGRRPRIRWHLIAGGQDDPPRPRAVRRRRGRRSRARRPGRGPAAG